jgi:threonine/homoserine/homoserine lactone efflux protein
MSIVFLKMDLGPGFALYAIGTQILSQPWFWIIGAMLAYLAFEMFRARRRQKRRKRAEADHPANSN